MSWCGPLRERECDEQDANRHPPRRHDVGMPRRERCRERDRSIEEWVVGDGPSGSTRASNAECEGRRSHQGFLGRAVWTCSAIRLRG